jgi:hypothetical protein
VEIVGLDLLFQIPQKKCKNHRKDGGRRKLLKVNNGGQFRAQECWGTVGEEALFYRVRKLPVTEF